MFFLCTRGFILLIAQSLGENISLFKNPLSGLFRKSASQDLQTVSNCPRPCVTWYLTSSVMCMDWCALKGNMDSFICSTSHRALEHGKPKVPGCCLHTVLKYHMIRILVVLPWTLHTVTAVCGFGPMIDRSPSFLEIWPELSASVPVQEL